MKKNTHIRRGGFIQSNDYKYRRKNSLRLKEYDYTLPGPYFVKICSNKRENLLKDSSIRNKIIDIIKTIGVDLSAQIHSIVIATDHIHGLFSLPEDKTISLSKFIVIIKVRITQFLKKGRVNPPLRVWQRGFYDHIIRNEKDFLEKAHYIENHPIKEEGNICEEWH